MHYGGEYAIYILEFNMRLYATTQSDKNSQSDKYSN
jgi:hypothetical protein